MAHSAPPPAAPGWSRWNTQPQSPEYGLLDGSTFVQYDTRATTPVTLQRPSEAQHYLVGNAYTMAPTMAHTLSHTMAPPMAMPAPQYPGQHQYGFGCVTPPSPESLLPSFRQYQDERPRMMGMDTESSHTNMNYARGGRPQTYIPDQVQAPAVKREQYMSPASPASTKDVINSKTITPTISADPEKQTEFHTDVDTLMKTIQVKSTETTTPAAVDHGESRYPSPPHAEPSPETSSGSRNTKKRHPCTIPNCPMRFSQKTHLSIHVRSHTDERPYPCTQPGCNYRFSQLGNLKTHERRHTGEKPYACEICGKRFAQRGNVRAHKETHNNFKRFACRIDGCTKKFSQLGNMKTHQNKFHAETIKALTAKFAAILRAGEELKGEDKELFEYFAVHYKNSNKGIKGRGKDRKVNTINSSPAAPSSHYPGSQPSTQQQQQHQMPHGLPYSGLAASNAFGHYSTYNMLVGRESRRGYEYDMDHDSVSGSSATGTLYEDEHHFNERFQDRLY
ncbi:uncharacterized protein B0I36DRAFT_361832 [Microdochium trichocladiopsis]|uniref:C2H2-type domain-containing protein n=1 Tax=Microdochium trichocladiopsis TaxID=1682393 RepID=A0A9P8YB60_9PEZI|nr:uncharacterized protein B0I36DRAFT_361832 [Microdochium trichocladiopsis]KAH7033119.1 hypothetical protein B0I36DRAFT_361832 [Microdochium trichocladiopsis]